MKDYEDPYADMGAIKNDMAMRQLDVVLAFAKAVVTSVTKGDNTDLKAISKSIAEDDRLRKVTNKALGMQLDEAGMSKLLPNMDFDPDWKLEGIMLYEFINELENDEFDAIKKSAKYPKAAEWATMRKNKDHIPEFEIKGAESLSQGIERLQKYLDENKENHDNRMPKRKQIETDNSKQNRPPASSSAHTCLKRVKRDDTAIADFAAQSKTRRTPPGA